jgi:hypothetical protein
MRRCILGAVVIALPVLITDKAAAQATLSEAAQAPAQQQAPRPARETAAVDLTGYWVSIVTEDWLYRMLTPARGDYAGVPLNPEGLRVADNWEPATEGCKPYGAAGLMRIPGRLHVTWQDDNTLRMDTDAGTQTRLFRFGPNQPTGEATLQGYSAATWIPAGRGRGGPAGDASNQAAGTLKVVTTRMTPAYLRKNGVPYSEKATLTEYYERLKAPNGAEWLVVTSIVEDPVYLTQPFITSTHFRQEPDAAKWSPTTCGGAARASSR